jgi:acyl-CoA synthetase (AMP-forming)/AMP-acid ligase II
MTMTQDHGNAFAMRLESHFGDRVVRCFSNRPGSIHAMLEEAVARRGMQEALVCGTSRLTWNELHEAAMRFGAGLRERGIGQGERIVLLLGNRNEFVIAALAVMAIGAVIVPVSIREKTPGLTYLFNNCAAAAVIHDGALGELLPPSTHAPTVRLRIAADPFPGSEDFSSLLSANPLREPAVVDEEDVAAILYTSGTTGKPKGAMLTHFNIVHSVMHYEAVLGFNEEDRLAVVVPLSHVTGLVALMLAAVRCAGALIVVPDFRAPEFLMVAERERMTATIMVPAMYNLCLMQETIGDRDLSAWRIGGYGGAPMPLATIQAMADRFPRLTLINAYGATETASPATMTLPGDAGKRGESVGVAVPCGEILIVDEAGRELPRGEAGEVWLRGPMVVKGYWDNPAATAANFTGGYWHSGDVGSLDEEGYLSVFDRRKDMLNRGGYKIYSVEVENVLAAHPAVVEAAVVGKPCPVLGERVHVFVSVASPVSEKELSSFCSQRLADYKVPEGFIIQSDPLPRNPNGKLLKRELRDRLLRASE